MPSSSRARLLSAIAGADGADPPDPWGDGKPGDAEDGVHGDLPKLTNPDAWVGDADQFEGPVRLPWDVEEPKEPLVLPLGSDRD